jgi:hypothetical protein
MGSLLKIPAISLLKIDSQFLSIIDLSYSSKQDKKEIARK